MIRITVKQIPKARELLDMLYKPAEIARELDAKKETIYAWTRAGLPTRKDDNGRMWIHGISARDWILSHGIKHTDPSRAKRAQGEAYCLSCRSFRKYKNAKIEKLPGGRLKMLAKCATCGKTICQFQNKAKDEE